MSQLELPLFEPGPDAEYLTIAEAARRLRCCERTVRRAIDSGSLRAGRIRATRLSRGAIRIRGEGRGQLLACEQGSRERPEAPNFEAATEKVVCPYRRQGGKPEAGHVRQTDFVLSWRVERGHAEARGVREIAVPESVSKTKRALPRRHGQISPVRAPALLQGSETDPPSGGSLVHKAPAGFSPDARVSDA